MNEFPLMTSKGLLFIYYLLSLFILCILSERSKAQPFVLPLPGWSDEPSSPAEAHERGGRVGQPPHRTLPEHPVR